jgi:serine/threonine-protein kinase
MMKKEEDLARFPEASEDVRSAFEKPLELVRRTTLESSAARPEAISRAAGGPDPPLPPVNNQVSGPTVTYVRGAPAEELPRAVLRVIAGPHQGVEFEFERHETFLVGRAAGTSLQLIDDPHFSRHHLLLEFNPPRCFLRDLGSSNGTFVNGRKVATCYLNDGDVISGGQTQILYRRVGPAPTEPPTTVDVRTTADRESGTLARTTFRAGERSGAVPPPAVPGYEVIRPLGHGGMGAVFLARELVGGREVAVKVLVPESAVSERATSRFLREISVLCRLDHPRIVRFLDMGMAHGQFYFAMEYVRTVDLAAWLAAMDIDRRIWAACAITCDVLEGLAFAHASSFVHRDIKPANILVTPGAGGAPEAKLADFGLAKNFENAGFSGMTHEGQVMGTVAFMAPEQVLNARFSRPSVDLYSAGASLFHMLTGSYPYDFDTAKDKLRVILEDDAIPLERHIPDAPGALVAAVRRSLAKSPPDRFPSAEAMRAALLPFTRS